MILLVQSERTRCIIQNASTDIHSSLPYLFGLLNLLGGEHVDAGAMETMQSLYICASTSSLHEEQRWRAITQLEYVGRGIGIVLF
jgi:hypothetical protein